MYKIHSGGAKRPHPAEGGAVDFVYFFVDFPCAVCGFPAYLPVYICAYVYVYRKDIQVNFAGQERNRPRNDQKWVVFTKFFEKIEALNPNVNILISKYAPECEKYRKIGPKQIIYFS